MSSLDIEHILQQVRDLSESDRAVLVEEFVGEFTAGYTDAEEVKGALEMLRGAIDRAVDDAIDAIETEP